MKEEDGLGTQKIPLAHPKHNITLEESEASGVLKATLTQQNPNPIQQLTRLTQFPHMVSLAKVFPFSGITTMLPQFYAYSPAFSLKVHDTKKRNNNTIPLSRDKQ